MKICSLPFLRSTNTINVCACACVWNGYDGHRPTTTEARIMMCTHRMCACVHKHANGALGNSSHQYFFFGCMYYICLVWAVWRWSRCCCWWCCRNFIIGGRTSIFIAPNIEITFRLLPFPYLRYILEKKKKCTFSHHFKPNESLASSSMYCRRQFPHCHCHQHQYQTKQRPHKIFLLKPIPSHRRHRQYHHTYTHSLACSLACSPENLEPWWMCTCIMRTMTDENANGVIHYFRVRAFWSTFDLMVP